MRVLSLFDGISCGQVALKELGIIPSFYYASEINKHAIVITQKNHPNTIQLGDVTQIDLSQIGEIDLLLAGFPCQDFSLLGNQAGLEGDRGKLFVELMHIKQQVKPKYFLFENTMMNKDTLQLLTNEIGVAPVKLNSSHFSPQSRDRYYWTNIPLTPLPDKNQSTIASIYDHTDTANILDDPKFRFVASEGKKGELHRTGGVLRSTSTLRYNKLRLEHRVYSIYAKHPTLVSSNLGNYIQNGDIIRRPNILERERLMGLPDNYTKGISKTQSRFALGNGWEVNTIKYLLSFLTL